MDVLNPVNFVLPVVSRKSAGITIKTKGMSQKKKKLKMNDRHIEVYYIILYLKISVIKSFNKWNGMKPSFQPMNGNWIELGVFTRFWNKYPLRRLLKALGVKGASFGPLKQLQGQTAQVHKLHPAHVGKKRINSRGIEWLPTCEHPVLICLLIWGSSLVFALSLSITFST